MRLFPHRAWLINTMCVLSFFFLGSCAERSLTRINIKKTNDAILETQKTVATPKPTPPKIQATSESGPVPMSTFMSAPVQNVIPFANKWFPRLQSWAKTYRDIAIQEQDVRNYSLSAKYSTTSLLWANRSLDIKDLSIEKASAKVQDWVNQLTIPDLPEEPTYFSGQDVYKKTKDTRKRLEELSQRFCLASEGVQIVPSLAYLELSTDLLNQKKYVKASTKIENAVGPLDHIEEEIKKCKNPTVVQDPKN